MTGSALPAVLGGLAVLVLVGVPGAASGRLAAALPSASRPGPPVLLRLPAPRLARSGRAVAAVAGLLLGLLLGGPVAAVVGGALGASAASSRARRVQGRAAAQERGSAAEACTALAAELRAGRAPGPALEAAAGVAAGPLRQRLLAGASAARLGGDVPAALRTGPASAVPEVVAGLAACWQVCAGTGSGLAAAVERLEEGLRSRDAARRAVEAELAGPRATAGLLAVLPLGGIALAAGLGARPVQVLLHTAVGSGALLVGVALDLLGLAWSRRIARSAGV